jgi:hypothetical protein
VCVSPLSLVYVKSFFSGLICPTMMLLLDKMMRLEECIRIQQRRSLHIKQLPLITWPTPILNSNGFFLSLDESNFLPLVKVPVKVINKFYTVVIMKHLKVVLPLSVSDLF